MLTTLNVFNQDTNHPHPPNRTVVRVKTSYWCSSNGIHSRKDVTFQKRKCTGFNLLEDDCSCVGGEEVAMSIENLYQVSDGLYEVVVSWSSRDWETGEVQDVLYKLIPYVEEKLDAYS